MVSSRTAWPLGLLLLALTIRAYESWQPRAGLWEGGTPASQVVQALALDGRQLLAGTLTGLYVSTDGGRSWEATPDLAGERVDALAVGEGRAFAAGPGTAWERAGGKWSPVEPAPGGLAYSLLVEGNRLLEATEEGLFERQFTGPATWRRLWPSPGDPPDRAYTAIVAPDRLFVGTDDGVVELGAPGWRRLGPERRWVRGIAIDGTWMHVAVEGASGGPWRAHTGSMEWAKGDVMVHGATTVILDPANPSGVIVSLSGLADDTRIAGVVRSRDHGESWESMGSRLANVTVSALALDSERGVLYAGTNGGGVFHYRFPSPSQQALAVARPVLDVVEGVLLGWLALALLRRPARKRALAPKGPRSHPTT